jgi:hypothetical protein
MVVPVPARWACLPVACPGRPRRASAASSGSPSAACCRSGGKAGHRWRARVWSAHCQAASRWRPARGGVAIGVRARVDGFWPSRLTQGGLCRIALSANSAIRAEMAVASSPMYAASGVAVPTACAVPRGDIEAAVLQPAPSPEAPSLTCDYGHQGLFSGSRRPLYVRGRRISGPKNPRTGPRNPRAKMVGAVTPTVAPRFLPLTCCFESLLVLSFTSCRLGKKAVC